MCVVGFVCVKCVLELWVVESVEGFFTPSLLLNIMRRSSPAFSEKKIVGN